MQGYLREAIFTKILPATNRKKQGQQLKRLKKHERKIGGEKFLLLITSGIYAGRLITDPMT